MIMNNELDRMWKEAVVDRYLNPGPPEYGARVLTTWPRHLRLRN
jgi:hypothetical protein